MTDITAAAFAPHVPDEPESRRIAHGSPFVVRWVQRTEARDILRSRSFSTRAERDTFRGVLDHDPDALHVEVEHVSGADYLPDTAPRFIVIGDEPAFGRVRRALRSALAALTVAAGLAGCTVTMAPPMSFGDGPIPAFQHVAPPFGFIGYCNRNREDCTGGTDNPQPVTMTPEMWSEADLVNRHVNALPQVSDRARYGIDEFWTVADAEGGDCEDLAIAKRLALIERGWPASALLLATVTEWNGDGHAVLVIRTYHGDFVLDNKSPTIERADAVPYLWNRMQSDRRPWAWVNLDAANTRDVTATPFPPVSEPAPFMAEFKGRE